MPYLEDARNGLSRPVGMKRPLDRDYLLKIIPLIQDRARTLGRTAQDEGLVQLAEFFFVDDLDYDPKLLLGKHLTAEQSRSYLGTAIKRLADLTDFGAATLEGLLRPLSAELGVKTGDFFGLLRTATTGRTAAPPLFQTMEVLGKERCFKRLKAATQKLAAVGP